MKCRLCEELSMPCVHGTMRLFGESKLFCFDDMSLDQVQLCDSWDS